MQTKKDNVLSGEINKAMKALSRAVVNVLSEEETSTRELRESLGLKEYEKFYVDTPQCMISQMSRTMRNQQINQPYHFQDKHGVVSNTGMVSDVILEQLRAGIAKVVKF